MGAFVSATTAMAVNCAVTVGERLEQRDAFGAHRQTVGRVLDVAAVDDLAVGGQQRRADLEVRVRRDRARAGVACGLDERVIFRAWPMMPSSRPMKDLPHTAGRLDDFFLGQRLRQDAGRHVRDAGNAQHFDAHVPRDDGFGNRRHARPRPRQGPERANLRGRFVARPGHGDVDAMLDRQPQSLARPRSQCVRRRFE